MNEQEVEIVCFYQAVIVNIQLMQRIADDMPTYITLDWNAELINGIPKLHRLITQLEEVHQIHYGELLDNTITSNMIDGFINDVSRMLEMTKLWCQVLESFTPEHDAWCFC